MTYRNKNIMVSNPELHKSKDKPYFHQISIECIEKISDCMEKYGKSEIDVNTCFEMEEEILKDEIDDQEFLNFASL